MAKIGLLFHKQGQSVIESSYDLLPGVICEIAKVVYKSEAVRLLLLDDM